MRTLAGFLLLALVPLNGQQTGVSTDELQKRLKNPFAQVLSLSYTNEFSFGAGGSYLGTFQPVIPLTAGSVSFISRPVFSFTRGPSVADGRRIVGTGDLGYQLFLTPARPGSVIWGIGPALTFPTASREVLGNGKWSAGPTIAVVVQPGKLSLAVGATNRWSFAGDKNRSSVHQFSLECVADYRVGRGWSLSTGPEVTNDWRGAAGERWFVPVGGGVSKAFNGRVPVQFSVLAYRHVVRPALTSSWSLQISVTPVVSIK
jgi:hypothetical protein